MNWLNDIKKELEDSKSHPIRDKKDWEIQRDILLKDIAGSGGKIGGQIGGKTNKD